jgi:anti-sigma B factor antagonist
MDINIKKRQNVTIVEMDGDLDGKTAPVAQEQILSLAKPDCKIILDMSKVAYMSSAGLRLLLVTYRTISGQGGKAVLVGLSEDLENTMSVTGFLDFFDHYNNFDAALATFT